MAAKKVTQAPTSLSKKESIEVFMQDLNKSLKGRASIDFASNVSNVFSWKRFPTGILTLDLELGGGFPAGGLSQIAGPKNSCKTYMYWQMIRELQTIRGENTSVLLAMTEMVADKQQARLAGVKIALEDSDIIEMNMARESNGVPRFTVEEEADLRKQVGNISELHADSAEALFDGILRAVEKNIFELIVIDSVGSLISFAESEAESLTQKTYGGSAKVITSFLGKLNMLLASKTEDGQHKGICIIAVNQVRDNIGDPYKAFKTNGGRALEHAKLIDLWLTSGAIQSEEEQVYTPMGTKKRFVQFGKEINWKIEKGKAGIHEGGKGSFLYDFRSNSVDKFTDSLVAGVTLGVIEQAGAWLGLKNPDKPGEFIIRCQGKDAFVKALMEDKQQKDAENNPNTLMTKIRDLCYRAKGLNISYNWPEGR